MQLEASGAPSVSAVGGAPEPKYPREPSPRGSHLWSTWGVPRVSSTTPSHRSEKIGVRRQRAHEHICRLGQAGKQVLQRFLAFL
ncbi:MAG: hypothetical protein JWP57_4233 [Spirosoma sp.]|nr:hypothetical protein [Spirosoma sp.]